VAAEFGATVVVDTITESGKKELLPAKAAFSASFAYLGDRRSRSVRSIHRPHRRRRRSAGAGFRVALAGGIAPDSIDAVLAVEP
jgi:3-hexulose-6-phosphate synthase